MQTVAPVGVLGGQANELRVLAGDRGGVTLASREKVEVENTADDVVLEGRLLTVGLVELDVHAVGVEEDAMCAGWAMLLVDGVRAVEVGAGGDEGSFAVELGGRLVEDKLTLRRGEEGTHQSERRIMIIQPKPIRMLAQTIDIRTVWQRSLDPQVLILK